MTLEVFISSLGKTKAEIVFPNSVSREKFIKYMDFDKYCNFEDKRLRHIYKYCGISLLVKELSKE